MLSDRLQHIYNMTPNAMVIADVGTDHGYLPIALIKGGKATKAYAMDINVGPLKKAEENIKEYGMEADIQVILSDGLEHLPSDTDTVIIAGMGGMLIGRILSEEREKADKLTTMILSPHLDEMALRRKIHQLGWRIDAEHMVEDNDKYYTVMRCHKGEEQYSEREYEYGKALMANRDPVWLAYLNTELRKLTLIKNRLEEQSSENAEKRLSEINQKLAVLKEVLQGEA